MTQEKDGIGNETVPAAVQPVVSNPLLTRVRLPGETVRLPSGGVFYTNGELDPSVKNGEVHVYPMVAIDEIMLKTPDKLLNGTAFEAVFKNCIPQIRKPMEMLAKDVDYLMVFLRKLSYGNDVDVPLKHNCADAKEHTYLIPLDPFIKNAKPIDPTSLSTVYSLKLENGQTVNLHPPKIGDVLETFQTFDQENTDPNVLHDKVIKSTSKMIRDVDGVSDKTQIIEWLRVMPIKLLKQLNNGIEGTGDWGPNFQIELQCKDCGEIVKTVVPFNPVGFFS